MKRHYYSEEEKQWLIEQDKSLSYAELTEKFNKEFDCNVSKSSISDLMGKRLKVFRNSNNKTKTQFKHGRKRRLPIGTEIVKAGYVWVKVADNYYEGKMTNEKYMTNWKRKQDIVWENNYGDIPHGMFVIFLDQNKMNCALENLYIVNRSVHVIMCKNKWYLDNPELTLTAIKYCELLRTIKNYKSHSRK